MRKIIFMVTFALSTLLLTSCEEELWEADDLVESTVWVASTTSTPMCEYYYYPEEEYFIVEAGTTLKCYPLSNWSVTEGVDIVSISFDSTIDDCNLSYNVSYNISNKLGTINITKLSDGSSTTSYINSLVKTTMPVDKDYK